MAKYIPDNTTSRADKKKRKLVQQVAGNSMYYTKGVNMTTLTE